MSSRVSAKIQQLVNTLKQPRRPPLREFFVDDFDELLEGQTLLCAFTSTVYFTLAWCYQQKVTLCFLRDHFSFKFPFLETYLH